jgi:DUF1365 family protein
MSPTSAATAIEVYEGKIWHCRHSPKHYAFSVQGVFVLIDVDTFTSRSDGSFVSYNRPALFSIYDSDVTGDRCLSLREFRDREICADSLAAGGRTLVLMIPRILGFVFNPLIVWFHLDADGELDQVVFQVHNTFGERHLYHVPQADLVRRRDRYECSAIKEMRVSPFNVAAGEYRFSFTKPTETFDLKIELIDASRGHVNTAGLNLSRSLLSPRQFMSIRVRYFCFSLWVFIAIHIHALMIFLRMFIYRWVFK